MLLRASASLPHFDLIAVLSGPLCSFFVSSTFLPRLFVWIALQREGISIFGHCYTSWLLWLHFFRKEAISGHILPIFLSSFGAVRNWRHCKAFFDSMWFSERSRVELEKKNLCHNFLWVFIHGHRPLSDTLYRTFYAFLLCIVFKII